MKFIFVIGVEGAGHDMFRALMHNVIKQPDFVLEGKWRNIMVEYWDSYSRYKNEFSFFSSYNRTSVKKQFHTIIQQYAEQGKTLLMEDMSFPYYQPRNAMRRPDIIDFVDLLEGKAELKMLVLYRNPVSATYSGIRRGFTKNIYEQARIIEDNLLYIDKHLSECDPKLYRTIIFEDFLSNPYVYLNGLAEWFGIDLALLEEGVKNLHEPYPFKAIPNKIKSSLCNFFSENRIRMWESLYSVEQQIPSKI